MIDITKPFCWMCAYDNIDTMKRPLFHFNIGSRRVHLCKEHFYELSEALYDFCKKDKRGELKEVSEWD